MSIPSTCVATCQDPLFHVLYGANVDYIVGMIEESVISIAREYPTPGVRDALHLLRPQAGDSLNRLRAKFFMLLNEDEQTRRKLSAPPPRPTAMRSVCPHKARRFYDELCDDILPAFVHCQPTPLAELVDRLREAYLRS